MLLYYMVLQSSFADPLLMKCLPTSFHFPLHPPLKLLLLRTSFPLVRMYDDCSKVFQRGALEAHFPGHLEYVHTAKPAT